MASTLRVPVQVDYRDRSYLQYQLARCLANNVFVAVEYLRGVGDARRKALIAKSLAIGLSRYPNRAEEFVEYISTTPVDYQGMLLAGCITSEMYGAILDCVVEGWLAVNHRRRGYGDVLRALTKRPVRWQALLERNNLPPAVIVDFDEQGGARGGGEEVNVRVTNPQGTGREKRRNERKRERAKPSAPPETDSQ